ncbi:fumarylacetoacetate hydrolase family protein [Corynebacterium epidermidicanis]|uniref:2-keto-4-pentenoate hydratase/2-oxohepta-3-ene-1,7-dioic acid hydratase n=1 Tax=Corynebacterium epidermidicanis TaxID=1050174 RepID=A0A0G3GUP6_9CORY|nr:fumarylacetoacetate hydrolase family protein [Corynebacterium epidermidicanis]AKK04225.1 2-keto-4-pentenoate hydratase/2-oxohepta-3-ene-1,7-dioic acid hydratase [Corynebacterium epidermidicanis]
MRIATLRTNTGTQAIIVDGPTTARTIEGFSDIGALLNDEQWYEVLLDVESEQFEFNPEDLAPVIPRPGKIICVGLNYAKHIREMGHAQPEVPTLFIKFPEALIGPYDDAEVPEFANKCADFEGEMAVVIGAPARNVAKQDADGVIAGYTIINDFTMRDFQKQTQQWHQGKSFENTAGFGPWLDVDFQPGATLTTRVDGEVMQLDSTGDLIFSPGDLIEFISRIYTLQPGDVIATGTPEGVGHAQDPKRYLRDGETVEIEIDGLGSIKNRVKFV